MDRISQFPDEILLRILSSLPTTKDVVRTMVLSKRWQPLWMMVPKLVYDDHSYQDTEHQKFSRFVDRSLLLHKAPILETLHFKLGHTCGAVDLPVWTRAADKLSVRELIIDIGSSSSSASPAMLPRSLYTGLCRMFVKLKLNNVILVEFSSPVSFPSLGLLALESVKYPGDEFVKRFLSSCPVLVSLTVKQCPDDNVTIFTVEVPSLEIAYLCKLPERGTNVADGFVIDAPNLEWWGIFDDSGGFCAIQNDMPDIVTVCIEAGYSCVGKIMGSITSVEYLQLCLLKSKVLDSVDNEYDYLETLEIGTCEPEWLNVLMCMLRASPNLKSLILNRCHAIKHCRWRPRWNKPSSVPECLSETLKTFEWANYEGTVVEKKVVAFILRNGCCLKKVTISSESTDGDKKLKMIKELPFLSRRSPTCHLTFD